MYDCQNGGLVTGTGHWLAQAALVPDLLIRRVQLPSVSLPPFGSRPTCCIRVAVDTT